VKAEVPALARTVKVIPYPRPEADDANVPAFNTRAKTLLYVGRVHPEKGLHLLIDAFTRLPAAVREHWKLVVIGPWESRLGGGGEEYRARLQTAAAGHAKIELRGSIFDPAELEREFRSARLFIYPSLAEKGETFGLAPLEAMAHGCAVLVSDLGCFHDFVQEGRTGFIFNHRSGEPAHTLREKIENVLRDEPLLARVAENGFAKSQEYRLSSVARQFLQDFEQVIHESHGRRATDR
ncbi:MAG TPA: glycosyltransferase family 4 protein, partial [Chthoniobacterales bacterium]